MTEYAIILAGGSGQRIGGEIPKQFIDLGGTCMLELSLTAFFSYSQEIKTVVAVHPSFHSLWEKVLQGHPEWPEIEVVSGGEERFHSVRNALAVLPENGLVAIHDAARPRVSIELIERSFNLAKSKGSAIPVWPVSDSLRHVKGSQHESVLRSEYVTVQTPQVFNLSLLQMAYGQEFSPSFTDDASVVEKYGEQVFLVEGTSENTKITTATDLDFLRFQINKG